MPEKIKLQPDDVELIRLLGATFLLLDRSHIAQLFPHRSERALNIRLTQLVRAGFLNRRQPRDFFLDPRKPLYYLGSTGQRILDPDSNDPKIRSRLKQARDFSDTALPHFHFSTSIHVKFFAARRQYPDFDLITWIPQYAPIWAILNRHGFPLRPDGYLHYAKKPLTYHTFIEADRGTYRGQHLRKKLNAYHRYALSGRSMQHFSTPHFRVLFITETPSRAKYLVKLASPYPPDLFLVTTRQLFFSQPLFHPHWSSHSSTCFHSLDEPTEPLPDPPSPP